IIQSAPAPRATPRRRAVPRAGAPAPALARRSRRAAAVTAPARRTSSHDVPDTAKRPWKCLARSTGTRRPRCPPRRRSLDAEPECSDQRVQLLAVAVPSPVATDAVGTGLVSEDRADNLAQVGRQRRNI